MISIESRKRWYRIGVVVKAAAGFYVTALGTAVGAHKYVLPTWPTFVQHVLYWINRGSFWEIWIYPALMAIGWMMCREGNSLRWEAIQAQVNTLQKLACSDQADDYNDNHRVTLFKHQPWWLKRMFLSRSCWSRCFKEKASPWSGWLVPVIRSGHTGKSTKTVFWAPDEGLKAEGIAGQCWARDASVKVDGLPAINGTTSSRNRKRYANRSNMPEWMVDFYINNRRQLARSFMAIPVKTYTFRPWGVIVIDSQSEAGIDFAAADTAFRTIAQAIGVLLEDLK